MHADHERRESNKMLDHDDIRQTVSKVGDPLEAGTRIARQVADSLADMVTDGELSHHDADVVLAAMAAKARRDLDFWADFRVRHLSSET